MFFKIKLIMLINYQVFGSLSIILRIFDGLHLTFAQILLILITFLITKVLLTYPHLLSHKAKRRIVLPWSENQCFAYPNTETM